MVGRGRDTEGRAARLSRTISFRVSDATFERLEQLRGQETWVEFWMLCAIRHCHKILQGGGGRRGVDHYKRDIAQFQRELR